MVNGSGVDKGSKAVARKYVIAWRKIVSKVDGQTFCARYAGKMWFDIAPGRKFYHRTGSVFIGTAFPKLT